MVDASLAEDASSVAQEEEEEQPSEAVTPAPAETEPEAEPEPQETQIEEDEEEAASSPPVIQPIPRKRRGPGRPPRIPRPEDLLADEENSDGTPRRRRGPGRPATGRQGGLRGRPRHSKVQADRVAIDKAGNMVDVINDEADLPEDEAGEQKVDKDGNLQGDRDYRVRVFTIKGRENRLYMLSTEPARCTGFRDSYLFFNKHLGLFKIILNDEEKMDLIERDLMPHSYKGRSIGVVTARSVFREFGARIVIGGRRVIDDYHEAAARERGDVEGELADPNDRLPPAGEPYNKNQYVAWHGASQVYHTQPQGVTTMPVGKRIEGKRRTNVTVGNWQYEHANEAKKFNSSLTALRRANLAGVYDTHTNLMLYPKIMQPTHARWTPVPRPSTSSFVNGEEPFFPTVPPKVYNNYLTTDTVFVSPAENAFGVPGPDGDACDLLMAPNGLSGVPADVRDELPEACRRDFDAAVAAERAWKDQWTGETGDGARGRLKIGYAGFPV
ncbi:hypothetical protein K461DRAFT_232760 [Myriangium duriaei CBS 260.36]|uniref:Chromatin structure-remodeling complex protein RSC7 n=1 Tax=Myriangium duriaei CBS 260.36 TaxID=1168546 RepID=A0A9P4IUV9_9PEZI|nr:hypothetical protein K461DRAFT_232760 [Myriangium duriaei CBS 260.36]